MFALGLCRFLRLNRSFANNGIVEKGLGQLLLPLVLICSIKPISSSISLRTDVLLQDVMECDTFKGSGTFYLACSLEPVLKLELDTWLRD